MIRSNHTAAMWVSDATGGRSVFWCQAHRLKGLIATHDRYKTDHSQTLNNIQSTNPIIIYGKPGVPDSLDNEMIQFMDVIKPGGSHIGFMCVFV